MNGPVWANLDEAIDALAAGERVDVVALLAMLVHHEDQEAALAASCAAAGEAWRAVDANGRALLCRYLRTAVKRLDVGDVAGARVAAVRALEKARDWRAAHSSDGALTIDPVAAVVDAVDAIRAGRPVDLDDLRSTLETSSRNFAAAARFATDVGLPPDLQTGLATIAERLASGVVPLIAAGELDDALDMVERVIVDCVTEGDDECC